MLTASCTSSNPDRGPTSSNPTESATQPTNPAAPESPVNYTEMAVAPGPLATSAPEGLGPLQNEEGPSLEPQRAGERLRGQALPTNQWWSGLLTGEDAKPIWAMPLVSQITDDGIAVASPNLVTEDKLIISSFEPSFVFGGKNSGFEVTDFGAFDVTVGVDTDQGVYTSTIVQGWPAFQATVPEGEWPIEWVDTTVVSDSSQDHVRVEVAGKVWDVFVAGGTIDSSGSSITNEQSERSTVVFVPVPNGADQDEEWAELAEKIGTSPVTGTTAGYATDLDNGKVHQRLTWEGAGAVTLLPHQSLNAGNATQTKFEYQTPRGPLSVSTDSTVELAVDYRGLLPGVPWTVSQDEVAEDALPNFEQVKSSLADVKPGPTLEAGSYFGPKELGRLATTFELAQTAGVDRTDLLSILTEEVTDRITYSGPTDPFWLAYDSKWGGVIAMPAEFGSQDYNDHHFHYGYLIQAAVTVAEHDPEFVEEYGHLVDLLIADVLGDSETGLPPFRVFNPYLGHSYASGLVPFADGNNQESSSEALHAWWSISRWAQISDNTNMAEQAHFLYTLEAESARLYWLGDQRNPRPDNYDYHAAGIVWDGKTDFATWFDPDPGAIVGIQLLPYSFGSLYRRSPDSAQLRYKDAAAGELAPKVWPDLIALDMVLADPAKAMEIFESAGTVEDGNSKAFALYWLDSLTKLGVPSSDIWPDQPNGMAFHGESGVSLVVINPTSEPLTVTFRDDQGNAETIEVDAGEQKMLNSTEWSG